MMIRRDSDAILAAWLDAGPVTLPEHVRGAIVDGARTTRQSGGRQGARGTTPALRRFAAAAAAAVLVVAFASVGVGDRSESAPQGSPPPGPSGPSPEASDRTFTSSLYGYSIRIPGTWSATSASERWTGDWRWVLARVADTIRGKRHELTVVSGLIEPGANEQEWIDAHFRPRTSGSGYCSARGQMARPELPHFQFRQWGPIDWERFACGYVEGVAIEGGRAWFFSLRGRFEPGGDYEKFEELMRTVELHPEDIPSAVP